MNLNPETSLLEQIDINLEVEYNGGIQLAIDASSRFSKAAMVKIKGMLYFVCIYMKVSHMTPLTKLSLLHLTLFLFFYPMIGDMTLMHC